MNRTNRRKHPPKGHIGFYGTILVLIGVWALSSDPASATIRSDANDAAQRGLATVDSLLQVPAPQEAVQTARRLWKTLGDNPIYGAQLEGRLGLALMLADQPEQALPHLENVVRHHPREADHHRNLGAVLLRLNRRGRALSAYASAVELDPDNAELRREHGQMLLSFRDTRGAARELHLASELCGGCPEVDQPLASLYLMQQKFALAVPHLRRLYERAPDTDSRRILVAAMSRAGNDSLLVEFLAAGPPADRSTAEWRLLIEAEGRLSGQKFSLQAVADLRADAAPLAVVDEAEFWGQVALNLLAGEKFADGLRAADQAVALAPENVVYRNNRVVLLTRLGRDDEAREEWEKVLALDPSLAKQSP